MLHVHSPVLLLLISLPAYHSNRCILVCCLVVCAPVLVYMYYILAVGTEGYRASVYCRYVLLSTQRARVMVRKT